MKVTPLDRSFFFLDPCPHGSHPRRHMQVEKMRNAEERQGVTQGMTYTKTLARRTVFLERSENAQFCVSMAGEGILQALVTYE